MNRSSKSSQKPKIVLRNKKSSEVGLEAGVPMASGGGLGLVCLHVAARRNLEARTFRMRYEVMSGGGELDYHGCRLWSSYRGWALGHPAQPGLLAHGASLGDGLSG